MKKLREQKAKIKQENIERKKQESEEQINGTGSDGRWLKDFGGFEIAMDYDLKDLYL